MQKNDPELFIGLKQLEDSAFPKHCGSCSQEYRDAAEFLAATQPVQANCSGLKQSVDEGGKIILDIFRNCICGSTLLESFENRRDLSKNGLKRRITFQEILVTLVSKGLDTGTARNKLLKVMA